MAAELRLLLNKNYMLYVQSIEFMQGIENIKVFHTVEG